MKKPYCWYLALISAAVLFAAASSPLCAQDAHEWKGGKWVPVVKPGTGTPESELALVRELLNKTRYKKCVKAAKKFLARYGGHRNYEEVCLLAGRAELERGRYYQAYEWFERQLDQFPNGRYRDRALQHEFEAAGALLSGKKRIVLGFIKLPAKDEALEMLTRIAEHAPGTKIAERSLLRIGDYHYAKQQWVEATDAYDAFLTLFGKSPKAGYAMLQAARAAYSGYKGLAFDDTALLDAQQRFETFALNYPAIAQKVNVESILKQILADLAGRLYLAGEFYERTKRPSAAVFYYKQVLDRYPQTTWAVDARDALRRFSEVAPKNPEPIGAPRLGSVVSGSRKQPAPNLER